MERGRGVFYRVLPSFENVLPSQKETVVYRVFTEFFTELLSVLLRLLVLFLFLYIQPKK